jgi:DNA-binding MarR family transcriptional regulator
MHDPELERLAEEMWAVTKDLFRFLQLRDRDTMTGCGLTVAQCYAMDAIGAQRNLTLSELAEALYITPSTASRTVEEMVRKGLVSRAEDPADRRAVRLGLTPTGRALFEALQQHLVQRQLTILQQIEPGSRQDVLTALRKLSQAIKDPSCCAIPLTWEDRGAPSATASKRDKPPRGKRVLEKRRGQVPSVH